MEQKDIHEMIAMLMESLREQTQTIAGYEGRIPQIELDIVMSNLRKIYDYCSKLNMLNQGLGMVRIEREIPKFSNTPAEVSSPAKFQDDLPSIAFQPSIPPMGDIQEQPTAIAAEAFAQSESEMNPEVLSVSVEESGVPISSESFIDIKDNQPSEEINPVVPIEPEIQIPADYNLPKEAFEPRSPEVTPQVPVPQQAVVQSHEPEKENLLFSIEPLPASPQKKHEEKQVKASNADLFNAVTPTLGESLNPNLKPSLADKLSDQHQAEQNLASMLSHKNIGDMKEAIGINDKFLLINELFKGNQHHYTQALHFLNNAESFDEAMGMFSRMFSELKWKEDSKAVEKLRSLISRRHGAHQ